jgi:hypothetical protein
MSNYVFRQILAPAGIFPGKTTKATDLRALVGSMRITPTKQELIRLGPKHDGGYLIPDDLDGINYCFSPGVACCSDFEMQLAERGMQIFLADRSVEAPPVEHPSFHFQKKFIASSDCAKEGLMTLDTWYREMLEPPSDDSPEALLQMDIESSEYEVLHNISEKLLRRFRIIIIEFHKLNQLADRFALKLMAPAFRKLLKSHAVVHIHPNNHRKTLKIYGLEIPANMEVTLIRRDRLQLAKKTLVFPHPLDVKCNINKPELTLPKCWYA